MCRSTVRSICITFLPLTKIIVLLFFIENHPTEIKLNLFKTCVKMITMVAQTSFGFQIICTLLCNNEMQPLLQFLAMGLKSNTTLTNNVIVLLTTLLTMSQLNCFEMAKFSNLLDLTKVTEFSDLDVNLVDPGSRHSNGRTKMEINNASEMVFSYLYDLFRKANGTFLFQR